MEGLQVFRAIYAGGRGRLFTKSDSRQGFNHEALDEMTAAMVAGGPFYYFVFDCHLLECVYAHKNVTDFFDLEPGKFRIADLLQQVHPADLGHMLHCESVASKFISGHIDPEERLYYKTSYCYRMRHKDGKYRLVLHQGVTWNLDKSGLTSRTLEVITDISHITMQNNQSLSLIGMKGRPSYLELDKHKAPLQLREERALFSKREKEILRLMSQGFSAKEIGQRLFISYNTVRTHKQNMLRKADVKNASELLTRAMRLSAL